MDNPLSKLALDYWYHVLMVVGIVIFLLCGAGLLKHCPTVPTAMASLGCFFFGLGEWINHPQRTAIRTVFPAGVITGHPRSANALGIAFDLLGAALIGFGLYRLIA
jgi:hypothetical protein